MSNPRIQLSDHFTYPRLLRFVAPSITMMIFTSIYGVVDGFFVSNYIGKTPFAALNFIMPFIMVLGGTGFMLGTGGSALVAKEMGCGHTERANRIFTMMIAFVVVTGLILTALGVAFIRPIARLMGASESIMADCVLYGRITIAFTTAFMLQNVFQSFLVVAERPRVGLLVVVAAGVANMVLDALFIAVFRWGLAGAALATILSQWVSGIGLALYTLRAFAELRPERRHMRWDGEIFQEIVQFSSLTCLQQSVMNFGILMVQGLVNSFGPAVMAAFAAAVKIDTFAYNPVQDFGNAFSTFIAQNYGAGKAERIRRGLRSAFLTAAVFSILVSAVVVVFAEPLMTIFIDESETEIIAAGVHYLRVEGAFYVGIGILFLLYGLYRAVARPGVSVVLTVISLGTRVVLAYALSAIPAIGVTGIWAAVPIGWALADIAGIWYWRKLSRRGETLL